MAATKEKVDIDLLEEDDEFEEFPQDDWDVRKEDQADINVWEANWDDDKTDSEFSNHLSRGSNRQFFPQNFCQNSAYFWGFLPKILRKILP